MQYGQILSRSLSIAWRHRYLWLLALFAGESAGGVASSGSGSSGQGSTASTQMASPDWNLVTGWVASHGSLLWTVAIVAMVVFVVLFLVSVVANGALVRGSAEHDADRSFTLGRAWTAGLASFWPILQLKLFALLVVLTSLVVVFGLVAIAFVAGMSGATALSIAVAIVAGLVVLAAIPFWLAFGVALLFAVRAVVLGGMTASAALERGFRLVGSRLGRVALLWVLMLAVGIVAGMGAAIGIALITVVVAVIVVGAAFAAGFTGAVLAGVPFAVAWLTLMLAVAGAISAFNSTFWTLAYTRLEAETEPVVRTQLAPPSPA